MKSAIGIGFALLLAACGGGSDKAEPLADEVITGVSYVGVSVDDIDTAASFYKSVFEVERLGDEVFDHTGLPPALAVQADQGVRSMLMRSSNAQLRLMAYDGEPASDWQAVPVQGPGIAHVCFQAVDSTNVYERALAAGAAPIGARELVQLSSRNPVGYGYIHDHQGIITEVEEVDVAQLDLPAPPKNDYRMRHVALATPDLDALVDFYSAFLGGQEPRRIGNWFNISGEKVDKVSGLPDSEIEMAWFQIRNLELEIGQYHSHSTERPAGTRPLNAPGYNMIVFEVSDLAAAKRRLVDAGGKLVGGPASMDGQAIIFGRDPDGNLLGLQKSVSGSIYSARNFADNGI